MSLEDVLLVEESVGGGFGDVFGTDVVGSGQVGYGACQLYDAGAGSGGQAHVLDDFLQKLLAVRTQRTVFLYLSVVHGCIAEYVLFRKPVLLQLAGS